jgi:hypothetical protein
MPAWPYPPLTEEQRVPLDRARWLKLAAARGDVSRAGL